jgi:hypothetical protein
MVAGAALGGGLAAGVTAVVLLAAVALVVLAAANGAQLTRRVAELFDEQPARPAFSDVELGSGAARFVAPTRRVRNVVASHAPAHAFASMR